MTTWSKWTADRKIAALQEVWQRGMSASEIAKALDDKHGTSTGRNAIIGFYHRVSSNAKRKRGRNPLKDYPLNKANELTDAQRARKAEKERISAEKKRKDLAEKRAKATAPEIESQPFDDLPDEGRGYKLTAIKDGCRWPTGYDEKGRTLFCNHATKRNKSYCEAHQRRAVRGSDDEAA